MRPHSPIAAVGVLLLLAPVPAAAQAVADADLREVTAYRLTMPKLRQLNQAMVELQRQQEADPGYQALQRKKKELAALSEKENPTEAEMERMARLEEEIAAAEEAEEDEGMDPEGMTLDRMVERMNAEPRLVGALRGAGLAPREAAVMQLAFFQAALTAELMASGGITEIPKEANAENVRFYQANKAELATLKGLGDQEKQ
jgi:hypothetical protein